MFLLKNSKKIWINDSEGDSEDDSDESEDDSNESEDDSEDDSNESEDDSEDDSNESEDDSNESEDDSEDDYLKNPGIHPSCISNIGIWLWPRRRIS